MPPWRTLGGVVTSFFFLHLFLFFVIPLAFHLPSLTEPREAAGGANETEAETRRGNELPEESETVEEADRQIEAHRGSLAAGS